MSSWRGVPDFSQPLNLLTASTAGAENVGWRLYPATDEKNLFVYLPSRLEFAMREKNVGEAAELDFTIEAVRGSNPFKPPAPYGVLSFRLRPAPFPSEALAVLLPEHPGATVVPALCSSGWLWLQLLTGTANAEDLNAAAEFGTPVPLASNGMDSARSIRRLTQLQLSLLKRVLQEGTLTFTAHAQMELWGRAARLPVRLDFDPTALLAALRKQANAQGCLPRSALFDFWMLRLSGDERTTADLPITFLDAANAATPVLTEDTTTTHSGSITNVATVLKASGGFGAATTVPALLAQVLADWTAAELTAMIPPAALNSASEPLHPFCRLIELLNPPALVRWDLNQERLIPMPVLLEFNPFEAARQAVAAGGLAAVLTETIVPALDPGIVSLTLAANLPDNLQGVLHLGVDLLAPAHPPQRVQPLSASLLFDNPQAVQTVNWRFSPVEEIRYQSAGFAMVRFQSSGGGSVIRRLAGKPVSHGTNYCLLSITDFPVGFVSIKASDMLLTEALVTGVCSYTDPDNATQLELAFDLNSAHPLVTLCLPLAALPLARLRLEAHSISQNNGATEQVLMIGEFPAHGLRLDLTNLREYGLHAISVEVEFDAPVALVAIDLLPEGKLNQPEVATVLSLTPAQPARSWSYFAAAPFCAGYLYRVHGPADQPPGSWSAVKSPFDPLKLKATQLR
jgi:hypothetical protein